MDGTAFNATYLLVNRSQCQHFIIKHLAEHNIPQIHCCSTLWKKEKKKKVVFIKAPRDPGLTESLLLSLSGYLS